MNNLSKAIIWTAFLIGGVMLTGMAERDWPTTLFVMVWVVFGVFLIEANQASNQDDQKMEL